MGVSLEEEIKKKKRLFLRLCCLIWKNNMNINEITRKLNGYYKLSSALGNKKIHLSHWRLWMEASYREDTNLDQAFEETGVWMGQVLYIAILSIDLQEGKTSIWEESRTSEENNIKEFIEVNIFCRYFIGKMIMCETYINL